MPQTISAIVTNYNHAEFIGDAIESVLANQDPDSEVVVVDDGSTDTSREVLKAYASNPKVKVVLQENQGQAAAFSTGVQHAQGDVLCLFDGDDFWFPHKLRSLREKMDEFDLYGKSFMIRHPLIRMFEDDRCVRAPEKMEAFTPRGTESFSLGEFRRVSTPEEIHRHIASRHFPPYEGGNFGGSSVFGRKATDQLFPLPNLSKHYGDMMPVYAAPIVAESYIFARFLGIYRYHGSNHSITRTLEPYEFWIGIEAYLNKVLASSGSDQQVSFAKARMSRPYLLQDRKIKEALGAEWNRFQVEHNWVELVKTFVLSARTLLKPIHQNPS